MDLLRLIELGYDLDVGSPALHRVLVDAHQEVFRFEQGSFCLEYRFDRLTGVVAPDAEGFAMSSEVDPAALAVFEKLEHVQQRYPEAIREFYGGLHVATMTQRLRESSLPDELAAILDELYTPLGIRDFHSICATNLDGHGILLTSTLARPDRISLRRRRVLAGVAVHLAAAVRLRARVASFDDAMTEVEAVFEPGGKVAHAEGEARERSATDVLRDAVRAVDRARTRSGRASPERSLRSWPGLVRGRWTLVDFFDSDGRRFVVARPNEPEARRMKALSARERQVVGFAAEGHPDKLIAYELGVTEGAVAAVLHRARRKLGLPSRTDVAALRGALDAAADQFELTPGVEVLTAPSVVVPPTLTAAEAEVARAVLRGESNAEIARVRRVSERTVRNQLSSIFEKLDVGSRAELAARLSRSPQDP